MTSESEKQRYLRAKGNGVTNESQSETSYKSARRPQFPLDHGWAWMVMIGAFVNTTCVMIFMRARAMLFLPFMEKYDASATATTLALGINQTLFAISNLLQPGILAPRFQIRTLTIFGNLMNIISIVIIAYSPNIFVLIFAFALNGFGQGFIFAHQISLLGYYFKKRLSFASAFTTVGLSIATIAGPPFTQLLLETYGLSGAVLLIAGLNLHTIPASMLFRPVSFYRETQSVLVGCAADDDEACYDDGGGSSSCDAEDNLSHENKESDEESLVEEFMEIVDLRLLGDDTQRNNEQCASQKERELKAQTELKTRSSSAVLENLDKNSTEAEEFITEFKESETLQTENVANSFIKGAELSEPYSNDLPSALIQDQQLDDITLLKEEIMTEVNAIGCPRKSTSTSASFKEDAETEMKEVKSANTSNFKFVGLPKTYSTSRSKSVDDSNSKSVRLRLFMYRIKSSIQNSSFAHPVVALLIISSAVSIKTNVAFTYIPVLGLEQGLTESEASMLLTVAGSVDLLSKILIGLFADKRLVQPITLSCFAQIIMGVYKQFVYFYQGIGLMMLMQVVIGFTTGIFYVLLPVITVDLLGKEYIAYVMSGLFLLSGGITTIAHLVTGILKDSTGSFRGAFHFLGGLNLLGCVLLFATSYVSKRHAKRRKQTKDNDVGI